MPGVTDRAWRQVSVTSMECLGAQKCPLAAECFSELARQNAADADVVVTNHAMLAVSAFEGLAVLPEYDVVVVDEAHELQDRVTGAVSGQLSVAMVHAAASGARKHTGITVDALNNAAANLELRHRRRPQRPDAQRPEQRTARLRRPAARRLPRRALRFQGGQRQHGRRRPPARAVPADGHPGTVRTAPGRQGEPRSGLVLPQQQLRPAAGLLAAGRLRAGPDQHRPAQRRRAAARGTVRRPHRRPDLGHPGHRFGLRAGGRRPRPGRPRRTRAGPASTSVRPSNIRSRASSTSPSTCPSPAGERPRKPWTSSRS